MKQAFEIPVTPLAVHSRRKMTPRHYGILTLTISLLTVLLDAVTREGIAAWAFYPLAIFTALRWHGREGVAIATMGTISLTFLGLWISPPGDPAIAWINRFFGVLTISIVGVICLHLDRIEQELRQSVTELQERAQKLLTSASELGIANQKLEALASLDGLTGIANRRQLDTVLKNEWDRAQRRGTPFSVVLIDLDDFKAYNDHYGHQAGDQCLKRVAWTLSSAIKRPADVIGRYGGEEFLVLLPDTDEQGAFLLAEALRTKVEALKIMNTDVTTITMSAGVATAKPSRMTESEACIHAADQALYKAKARGKNRVETWAGGEG